LYSTEEINSYRKERNSKSHKYEMKFWDIKSQLWEIQYTSNCEI